MNGDSSHSGIDEPPIDVDLYGILSSGESVFLYHRELNTVQAFLNSIYFSIRSEVPAGTYGIKWILQNRDTRRVLKIETTREDGWSEDRRRLSDVGVFPGTRWWVLKLHKKS